MSRESNDGLYRVLWPRSPRCGAIQPLAPRLHTLAGKTVAQLWDYLFRGDKIFELVEEAFLARFAGVRFIHWREFGNTHGSDEREVLADLPRRLRELGVDAAISGMGC
jgi:hypothetical protein